MGNKSTWDYVNMGKPEWVRKPVILIIPSHHVVPLHWFGKFNEKNKMVATAKFNPEYDYKGEEAKEWLKHVKAEAFYFYESDYQHT